MKKLASLILALILCLGLASTALAEGETVAMRPRRIWASR